MGLTIKVIRYEPQFKQEWDNFIANSKNGNFLFNRSYMEYHADRFVDYSLMFFDECERLAGVLPASIHNDTVISHGGLTYGGVISDSVMTTADMLHLFDSLLNHLRGDGLKRLVYKPVPHIFHAMPAEEDLYALFVNNARLFRRDASSAIYLSGRLNFSEGKKSCIKKAIKNKLIVKESRDFAAFFEIGCKVMHEKYNRLPVHTATEMELLANRLPKNIRLHASFADSRMLAGVITYVFPTSVHIQYMYNSDEGMAIGALDIVLDHLINEIYKDYRFISFGISTENEGKYLNEGLIHQKEMFGGRTVVHDFYEVML